MLSLYEYCHSVSSTASFSALVCVGGSLPYPKILHLDVIVNYFAESFVTLATGGRVAAGAMGEVWVGSPMTAALPFPTLTLRERGAWPRGPPTQLSFWPGLRATTPPLKSVPENIFFSVLSSLASP